MRVTRPLRSNFEAGSVREASRRAMWKALGLTDADIEKPKIAVVNSSSELAICFRHLDGVAAIVKEAVWAAGGLPFEIRTAAPSDFIISAGGSGGCCRSGFFSGGDSGLRSDSDWDCTRPAMPSKGLTSF